jgi:Dolichyl-phosphate-mannose-protein mannosyltransferase
VALFLAVLLLTASTSADYGICWDEPNYFHASDLHIQWLADFGKNLLHAQIKNSLEDDVIKSAWHWDPYHVPHPPFSRIVSGLTRSILSPVIDKFVAYRLAPAIFFALLVTVMYLWMTELFDRWTGLFSALSLLLTPNLFGFAHLAVTDIPLAAMWFLTVYCFWRGLHDWRWSLVLGIVWGIALSTKFPALLIPIPLLLWAHLYHRHSYANNLFCMLFLGPVVMVASQPYLWHQTSLRILEFLYEGLSRAYRPDTNFPILFFNRLFFTNDLPWHYPFFILAVTTPEFVLVLALAGVLSIGWLRAQRDVLLLFLLNALFVPFLGLLPGAVLHDGVRQLLSAFSFVAGLAGAGFFVLIRSIRGRVEKVSVGNIKNLQSKVVAAAFVLLLFPPAWDLFLYHPYELSYYNRLVGGISGAYQRGLEVTYFMEAFTPEFLQFLNEKLPPKATINASFANFMFAYYQKENRLRQDIQITEREEGFDYYVLLTRRSVWSRKERILFSNHSPLAAVRLGDVPLISVYEFRSLK